MSATDGPSAFDVEYLRKRLPEVSNLIREAIEAHDAMTEAGDVSVEIEQDIAAFLEEAFIRPGFLAPMQDFIDAQQELIRTVLGGEAALFDREDAADMASLLSAGLAAFVVACRRRFLAQVANNRRWEIIIVCDDGLVPDESHRETVRQCPLTVTTNGLGTRVTACGTDEEWGYLQKMLAACERPAKAYRHATAVVIVPPGDESPDEEDGAS